MKVTADLLMKIAPGAKRPLVEALAQYMNNAFEAYEINTPLRVQHFLGQAAHETAGFKTLTEYASGAAYNGRKDLGNTQPNDGVTFKGRGIFQITGRFNYIKYGKAIGKDLVNNPTLAADPEVAVLTACEYWRANNLSALADKNDLKGITKRINGGYNGLADRQICTERAAKQMGAIFG